MRFWLRIPVLAICAVILCLAQATTQNPATGTPPDSESAAQAAPIEPPVLTPAPNAQASQPQAPASQTAPAQAPPSSPPASGKTPGYEPPPTKRSSAAPAVPKTDIKEGADGKPYVIGPLDVLYIRVWNNANLTGMVDVRSDGMISLALIGEMKADGLTVQQLIEELKTKLGDYLLNPEVDVQVTKVNSKKFLVVGAVGRQGEYPLVGKTTIFEALVTAGVREDAKQNKIYLLRGTEKHFFNYKDALQGRNSKQDIAIENGDRIIVPQ
jgi:polysaccharide export outer membrane protein